MTWGPRPARRLAVALAIAVLAVCATAGAATGPWVTYVDKPEHLSVTIPKSWNLVPTTIAGVQALIKQLKQQNQAGLANVYASLISTSAKRDQLLGYAFQAFDYSPNVSVQSDFALAIARSPKTYGRAQLASIATSVAQKFALTAGVKVDKKQVVTLPAGPAAYVEGTEPAGTGVTARFDVYVISRGLRIYELSFRTDTKSAGAAATVSAIAQRFRLGVS